MLAAVSLLFFFFTRVTIQYKTIYKDMLSNLELISSLQEDVYGSVQRQRLLGCCNLVLASSLWL